MLRWKEIDQKLHCIRSGDGCEYMGSSNVY